MSRSMVVLNGEIFFDGTFQKKDIRIENGKFAEIAETGMLDGLLKDNLELEIFNADGKYIIPGLVDVHTHGRIGLDFSKLTEEGLEALLVSYGTCGITSVVATTMTNEPSVVEKSLRIMGEYIERQENSFTQGAKLLGIHMEGPFLGKEKKGAHDEAYLQQPDWNWFEKLQEVSGGNIRLVTVDPDLDGADDFIEKCVANGVKVSLGHTACKYETAVKAEKLGANHVTHIFNAMNPLHHREPGLIGAAMDTGMYTELICDGIHVHPSLARMMFAAHPGRMVLISDSIPVAGMPDGEYASGGLKVTLQDGKAVLADGTIAGSAISLFDSMANAIKFGIPAECAVSSATYISAKSIGMEDVTGCIAEGRRAECLIVNKKWELEKVLM